LNIKLFYHGEDRKVYNQQTILKRIKKDLEAPGKETEAKNIGTG
jgi:hypothetical protein